MKAIVSWSVRNAPSMNTLMVAVLTVGMASMLMLRRERFPDFRPDEVRVSIAYPGASPTETEEGICLSFERQGGSGTMSGNNKRVISKTKKPFSD